MLVLIVEVVVEVELEGGDVEVIEIVREIADTMGFAGAGTSPGAESGA